MTSGPTNPSAKDNLTFGLYVRSTFNSLICFAAAANVAYFDATLQVFAAWSMSYTQYLYNF